MATGLLGGVLPYIYSRADALKRTLGDVVSNPMASTEQVVNNANDRAGNLNRLLSQVAAQGQRGLTSPQGQELARLYADAYNPVGMTAKDLGYRGSHLAPNAKTYGATLDDLTSIMPENVYTSQGKNLYGVRDSVIDHQWWMAAKKARGNPDAEVEVFRAVPKGVKDINSGDWVSTSRKYAEDHGESALSGEYEIISKKVKAKTLSTAGDPQEYGYNTNFEYPQQAALDLAQQRAALPVEQGGLGLPATNTAADRAKAMGTDVETSYIHSTSNPFTKINEDGKFSGIFTLPNYSANYGTLNMPLVARGEIATSDDLRRLVKKPTKKMQMAIDERIPDNVDIADATVEMQKLRNELARKYGFSGVKVSDEFGQDTTALVNPANIRSRFAAFDPFRKDVATATAMGVALPDLLAQPVNQYEPTYETIPMYTDPFGNTIGSSIR